MNLVKVISTNVDTYKRRVVKFFRMGLKDVQTAIQYAPAGIDSNPTKDMIALYGQTTDKGETVIVGYINKSSLANIGEFRFYSTDSNGNVKFYTWLKNDGTCEIGGNSDNLVRFAKLNTALQNEVTAINTELSKISAAINAIVPGAYIVTPISLNLTPAKINEIKTL